MPIVVAPFTSQTLLVRLSTEWSTDKHSSLLHRNVNYNCKKFYIARTRDFFPTDFLPLMSSFGVVATRNTKKMGGDVSRNTFFANSSKSGIVVFCTTVVDDIQGMALFVCAPQWLIFRE